MALQGQAWHPGAPGKAKSGEGAAPPVRGSKRKQRGQEPFMAGGMVSGVAERGAKLPGCFGSMFLRTAGESLRLAKHPHPALRADLSLKGEGF